MSAFFNSPTRKQYNSQDAVEALTGNISNLSFNTKENTTPMKSKYYTNNRAGPIIREDNSLMEVDDSDFVPGSSNHVDALSRSPKKLPTDFYSKASSSKTKRLVDVCQMFFLDYYCDMFDYVISRRERTREVAMMLKDQPNEQEVASAWQGYFQKESYALRKRRLKPRTKDFEMITQIGQGGYGAVYLARKKDTREIVALKTVNKRFFSKETSYFVTERDILTITRSDWLVKLFYAFQDSQCLYLAMEFVPGGDFRTLLFNTRTLISSHARFYISEMFCAVNALHELGYTHRDLKPENFLIDAGGHIKLTDFGLAAGHVSKERIESMKLRLEQVKNLNFPEFKERSMEDRARMYQQLRSENINYASSTVGSPDYMALEVLEKGRSYDFTADYWSLGCILFESLVGYTPFCGSNTNETYENLRNWKEVLRRPVKSNGSYAISDRTWELITRLIADPTKRLKSFEHVKRMRYFVEIDFDNLRKVQPPFVPQLDDETDVGYFDDFSNEEHMARYGDVFKRQAKMENNASNDVMANIVGFTFKHRKGKSGSTGILYDGAQNVDPFATFY
ncbi:probable Serine/threonine-protein kinase DBF20 [Saccharomycodes ludwigii]|uniref:non-specific serine/threonine protein kinase n=1 Tax=Saccharomycodes ludwigii TaxID=36035 RepID=A0A376B5D3_9ASCO|nr:hypothetical protein SCDLUD_002348 [Saccharomycodes ludwigii]KAH3900889.1 hypothetical protein SCDLUD_002348 [Saccharomycodes ludwigii]SSD59896.1 probable Serine/threonine-protein kinase DBF20 [Saccharomycodes ludwigii]